MTLNFPLQTILHQHAYVLSSLPSITVIANSYREFLEVLRYDKYIISNYTNISFYRRSNILSNDIYASLKLIRLDLLRFNYSLKNATGVTTVKTFP